MADEPPAAGPQNGIVAARPRVGTATALLLAAAFALLATPVVLADAWLARSKSGAVVEGKPAPVTVRVPLFAGYSEGGATLGGGGIAIRRGEVAEAAHVGWIQRMRDAAPASSTAALAYLAGLFLMGLLYTSHLRRSHTGRLRRTQLVTLGLLVAGAVVFQVALLLTPLSVLVVPVGALAICAALAVDVSVGLATGLAASALIGFLVPFDPGTVTVLAVQSCAPVLVLGATTAGKRRRRHMMLSGMFGGLCAATAYLVFHYLSRRTLPLDELDAPMRSAWLAATAGGLLSGVCAVAFLPLYQYLLGEITRNRLIELEDLGNPLLKQIAEKAPGTWQHSLAMANMAEVAANEIGASGRLVRVGAYYHDLGKSMQPSYFIENLRPNEPSPHDRLPPEVSCDAIFAHVTEGIRVARREGLPERIIDFMHMHHGDGVLEYFWAKCEETGNPKGLKQEAFRYPGVKPQTRETAILAICDAVEAASRTLKNPDEHAIRTLVQRIVYGKLHLGQLDESGLSVADLRRISNSLEATIRHAFHGRIEYPWQRQERMATEQQTPVERRVARELSAARSTTERFGDEPRLDSLDVPRASWSPRPSQPQAAAPAEPASAPASAPRLDDLATATTAQVKASDSVETVLLTKTKGGGLADRVDAALRETDLADAQDVADAFEGAGAAEVARAADGAGAVSPAVLAAAAVDDPDDNRPTDEVPIVQPVPLAELAAAEAAAAEPEPPVRMSQERRIAEWSDALHTATQEFDVPTLPAPGEEEPTRVRKRPPPPPGATARRAGGRATIPLMGEEQLVDEKPEGESELVARADSEDGALTPGMLVLGPPPATRGATAADDDPEPTKPGRR